MNVPVVTPNILTPVISILPSFDFAGKSDSDKIQLVSTSNEAGRGARRMLDSWTIFTTLVAKSDSSFWQDIKRYEVLLRQFVVQNLSIEGTGVYQDPVDAEINGLIRTRFDNYNTQKTKFGRLVAFTALLKAGRIQSLNAIKPQAAPVAVTFGEVTQEQIADFIINVMGAKNPQLLGQYIINATGSDALKSTGNTATDTMLAYLGFTIS
jgi:hypothetical protein